MISHTDPTGPNVLTQEEAANRAAVIHGVEYDLALSLRAGAPGYEGDVTIRFEHRDPAAGVFLDCTGEEIVRLDVNDADALDAEGVGWSRNRLELPGALLREANIVRVVYRNAYDHSGVGLHQFRDPEDGAGVPLHPVRALRSAPHAALLRPARHQGALPAACRGAQRVGGGVERARDGRRARARRRRRAAAHAARVRPDATLQAPTCWR